MSKLKKLSISVGVVSVAFGTAATILAPSNEVHAAVLGVYITKACKTSPTSMRVTFASSNANPSSSSATARLVAGGKSRTTTLRPGEHKTLAGNGKNYSAVIRSSDIYSGHDFSDSKRGATIKLPRC